MSTLVAVYRLQSNARSRIIAEAICQGLENQGIRYRNYNEQNYNGPEGNIAIFYGYESILPHVMQDYIDAGKTVLFIDLGYWGRRQGGRYRGYHKIIVNARHPTKYLEKLMYDKDLPVRPRNCSPIIRPWRKTGKDIVVAGMSGKAAKAVGLDPEHWERSTIAYLRSVTDRKILYRTKPTWLAAEPIEGTQFVVGASRKIEYEWNNCHLLVTRHSNSAVDALIEGVPVYCEDGAAFPLALHDLNQVENPVYPNNREQWLKALSWCQFTVEEMRTGFFWSFFEANRFFK